MDFDEIKRNLQDHFTDGLVVVVGSGLSAAEGVPGMTTLANYLVANVPGHLDKKSDELWKKIEKDLNVGIDLESTLLKYQPTPELEFVIGELTATLLIDAETKIIEEVVGGKRTLRFTNLLKHLLKPNCGIPVITTNYDRLIEVATEAAGLGVDTLFVGHHLARFNAKESQYSLCRGVTQRRKIVHLNYAHHVVLMKPHGSLDWFLNSTEPIRCPIQINAPRLIITPGVNKFRGGYERPFDAHRERANREIDHAARYLILGYGFNDDHLQIHLEHQIKSGKPTLIITHSLSSKVHSLISDNVGVTAIAADEDGNGSMVFRGKDSLHVPGKKLWDLTNFISEVLEP